MVKNKLKECCNECNEIDIDTDTNRYFMCCDASGIEQYLTNVTIYCKHSRVCKKYIEEDTNAPD